MPPEPHINGWTQITVWYSDAGGQHSNVLSYKSTLQPGPIDMQQIAQNFWAYVGTAYKAMMTAGHNFDRVEARTRWVGVNYLGNYYIPQPAPGTASGDSVPNNVAGAVSWKSGARGRSNQGRTFLGGVSETMNTLDTLSGAWIVAANTLANLIGTFTNSGSIPMTFVIASVKTLQLVQIFKYLIDAIVDSQRRRLTGRGQ